MPRSLADLAPETCKGLRGVVFDLDDTVTRAGRLELSAFAAMHELRAADLTLVCVTGRPLGWADVFARLWDVDVSVGENGAGWVWRVGERLHEGYFDDESTRRNQQKVLHRVRDHVSRIMPHINLAGDQRARRCDLAFDVGETVRLPSREVDQLTAIIREEGARSLVSSVHAHAVPGAWNKAKGSVRALREALSVELESEPDRWLFIGDSGNDEAAFEFFPVSVGVANVADHLPRMTSSPRYITEADRGLGFAEMASVVLKHRGHKHPEVTPRQLKHR